MCVITGWGEVAQNLRNRMSEEELTCEINLSSFHRVREVRNEALDWFDIDIPVREALLCNAFTA